MKKIITVILILLFSSAKSQNPYTLNTASFGIGAGYSHVFKRYYKESLTTDTLNSLQLQKLSRDNFVISSVISFRLGKLKFDEGENKFITTKPDNSPPFWWERFTFNVALNLLEINSDNLSFNKSIDGGLGLGYMLSPSIQLALFLDANRYRQLQDYVIEKYKGKPIPNGTGYFDALDENNDDLFYTKTIFGFSFKAVFTIGNKK